MPATLNLAGQRFGQLVALSRDNTISKGDETRWICKCDCGNIKSIRTGHLRSGQVQSCSHKHARQSRKSHGKGGAFVDKSGMRFGKLTVISVQGKYKNSHNYQWLCRCDCGNEKVISGQFLNKHKMVKSCGCLKEEKQSVKDSKIIRRMFGRLLVLEFSGYSNTNRERMYYCRCTCGNYTTVRYSSLKRGTTKSCGCLQQDYKYKNLIGYRFGSWTVLHISEKQKARRTWRCKCECGQEKDVMEFSLKNGSSTSCGCINRYESVIATEVKKYFKEKHGGIPEWNICKNPRTNYSLRCDVYIPKSHAYIEINGDQHYNSKNSFTSKNRKFYQSFSYRQTLDRLKREYAESHGIYIEVDLRKIKTIEEAITYIEERI